MKTLANLFKKPPNINKSILYEIDVIRPFSQNRIMFTKSINFSKTPKIPALKFKRVKRTLQIIQAYILQKTTPELDWIPKSSNRTRMNRADLATSRAMIIPCAIFFVGIIPRCNFIANMARLIYPSTVSFGRVFYFIRVLASSTEFVEITENYQEI